jgi:hypothetical protein
MKTRARRPKRKNPSRPLRRGVVQAPRSLGEKILPWSTTGSALRAVAVAFLDGRPVPQADVRRALYAIRTLRTRYADRELATIERALADRVEPRENPSVECSRSKKLDRYRHAEVIHEGERVALDGCFAKGRAPAYAGEWKTGPKKGKRTTITKRAVRQKASRSPSRVKGVRARKRR